MNEITFTVKNFRALRNARFQPRSGVSALVGANGSGKSTLLDLIAIVRDATTKGYVAALDAHGGPRSVVTLSADQGAFAQIIVEAPNLQWTVDLRPGGTAVVASEQVRIGSKVCSVVGPSSAVPMGVPFRPPRPQHPERLHTALVNAGAPNSRPLPWFQSTQIHEAAATISPVNGFLGAYHHYHHYNVDTLRRVGSQAGSDTSLASDGLNVFTVLRNWRDKRADEVRYQFVVNGLKMAFPETFEALEFETAGQTVAANFFTPGQPTSSISHFFAPDGLLVGLLHLAAVASSTSESLIAIDEFENSLHPFAIRALLDVIEDRCNTEQIRLLTATHSPVVLDHFKGDFSRVLIMDNTLETTPSPLDEVHDPEWLAHFSLGDLYEHDEIAPQTSKA